ncbi:MAG: hypothetical protein HN764_11170 [Gammaproteobacteria bacterium]|jgi:5-(aminomethyl)-3-furanmethanol phosphate kinase|nr:hypothetical protein [Gammaproteobacteria bacterium]
MMWVVKIGGSLQESDCLSEWLNCLVEYGAGRVVIVPGGGKYADAVREDQLKHGFDDVKAHKLALLAMEQYAQLLNSIVPELQCVSDLDSINSCLRNNQVPVWLPYKMIVGEKKIPASWEAGSDALAIWLAKKINSNAVMLVKSVNLPEHYSGLEELAGLGLIDKFSTVLLEQSNLSLIWMHRNDSEFLSEILNQSQQSENSELIYAPGASCPEIEINVS